MIVPVEEKYHTFISSHIPTERGRDEEGKRGEREKGGSNELSIV